MDSTHVLQLVGLAFCAVFGIMNRLTLLGLAKRLAALERVGVLMTQDKDAGRVARPMTPREKIRWYERRINGTQRATP